MLAAPFPFRGLIPGWKDFLYLSSGEELQELKRHETSGRPLGSDSFVDAMEHTLGRVLRPKKPGPSKRDK